MFSWMLSGSLGEFLAPIPDTGARFEMLLLRKEYDSAQQLLLEIADSVDLNECGMNGQNFLHAAAAAGATDVVIRLVAMGVDVNRLSSTGSTALHFASKMNHLPVVDYLLRCGADPTIVNQAGSIPLDLTTDPQVQQLLRSYMTGSSSPQPQQQSSSATSSSPPLLPQRAATLPPSWGTPTTPTRQPSEAMTTMKMSTPPARTTAAASTPMGRKARTVHFSRYGTPVVGSPLPQPDDNELRNEVLRAAIDTAHAFRARDHEWKLSKQIFTNVTRWTKQNRESLREALLELLRTKPDLVRARSCQQGTTADGLTPLHAAAQAGNAEAIQILCEVGNADPWARDLQGKTPLHLAAKAGHEAACEVLREFMRARKIDPVGEFAPVDLVGSTPLATVERANPKLTQSLFKPGDRSILPTTPWEVRCGATYEVQILFAHSGAQNFCDYMEDRLVCMCPIQDDTDICVFGVFDGHGGCFTADFVCANIVKKLLETATWQTGDRNPESLANALRLAFIQTDEELRQLPQMQVRRVESKSRTGGENAVTVSYTAGDLSGSTANVVLVTPTHIIVANAGDSRAVLGLKGPSGECQGVPLSVDHKINLPGEHERIVAAGGIISSHQIPRINRFRDSEDESPSGFTTAYRVKSAFSEVSLAMSRSLGDFVLKSNPDLPRDRQIVIAEPEVRIHPRSSDDELLLICSDGVWDGVGNDEAAQLVHKILRPPTQEQAEAARTAAEILSQGDDQQDHAVARAAQEERCARAADALLEAALSKGSTDNMVAIVVDLNPDVAATTAVSKKLFE